MPYTPVLTIDAFHSRYNPIVMLQAILGDLSGCATLQLAQHVWDEFPAFFQDYAEEVLETGPRAAAWSMQQLMRTIPGRAAYDGHKLAQEVLWKTSERPVG